MEKHQKKFSKKLKIKTKTKTKMSAHVLRQLKCFLIFITTEGNGIIDEFEMNSENQYYNIKCLLDNRSSYKIDSFYTGLDMGFKNDHSVTGAIEFHPGYENSTIGNNILLNFFIEFISSNVNNIIITKISYSIKNYMMILHVTCKNIIFELKLFNMSNNLQFSNDPYIDMRYRYINSVSFKNVKTRFNYIGDDINVILNV